MGIAFGYVPRRRDDDRRKQEVSIPATGLVNAKQAMKILGIQEGDLKELMDHGDLRGFRSSGQILFRSEDVLALRDATGTEYAGATSAPIYGAAAHVPYGNYVPPTVVPVPEKCLPQDPVIWVLPASGDSSLRPIALPEKDDLLEWGNDLANGRTVIVHSEQGTPSKSFEPMIQSLSDKKLSALKQLGYRALIGLGWVGFGWLVDRRIPEGVGIAITLVGAVVILYNMAKAGYTAYVWSELSDRSQNALEGDPDRQFNLLLEKIREGIKYREGNAAYSEHPSEALMDSKAYEDLSARYNIPLKDIVRLARTLSRETNGMTLAEIAQEFSVTLSAAGVYRDLAAAQISLEAALATKG